MPTPVKPIPEGYHSLTPYLVVKDPARALEFYKRAFGAVEISRLKGPDGSAVLHVELAVGNSRLMIGQEMDEGSKAVETLGGSPIALYYYVEDADSAFRKALEAGCREVMAPADMFWGDRCCTLVDPFGLQWNIATRIANLTQQEVEERARAFFAGQPAA